MNTGASAPRLPLCQPFGMMTRLPSAPESASKGAVPVGKASADVALRKAHDGHDFGLVLAAEDRPAGAGVDHVRAHAGSCHQMMRAIRICEHYPLSFPS